MKLEKKKKITLSTLSVTAICAMMLTGCRPDDVVSHDASSIDVNIQGGETSFEVQEGGQAVVTNENGEEYDDVSFSVRNSSVIQIDAKTGEFIALQPGVTDIIAIGTTDNKLVDSIEVTVNGEGANGAYDYSTVSWEEKANILGVLERYAQDTYLTGIPFCGDGQYVMYNERVNFPTENYIEGFGYGVIEYGSLDADDPLNVTDGYPQYYHTFISENPQSLADWNSNDTLVSELVSYISSGYFTTILNENYTDYEYMPLLAASNNFIAEDATSGADPTATIFKLYVKTDGVYYDTNSKNSIASQFDHREVQLEDYLTPFKILLTQKFGLFRGSEMTAESYARPIKGAAEYWAASANGINEEAFEKYVGVKTGTDDGGDYIKFEFSQPVSVSDARSNLSLSYWSPLPMDFFDQVLGGDATLYGTFNSSGSLTPVDTTLSTGPYTVSYYGEQNIVFELNEDYIGKTDTYDRTMYNIPGVYVTVNRAVQSDSEAAFREFLADHLDQCSIPGTRLDEYSNDPRTKQVPETTTWKLNINATTEDLWVELFGQNGTIYQNRPQDYWNIKPIMSNRHFLDGLYYSINRSEYSTSQNYSLSQNFLSDAYYFTDTQGGMHVYNDTDAHKAALKDRYPSTTGYNLDAARAMFRLALQEEIAAGHYSYGTSSNPTVITLEAKWMSTSSMQRMGEPITQYMENAFNSVDPRIQLDIHNTVAGANADAMYDAIAQGQFDIGLGAITGMQMYPIEFMNVLCSDNRSGFVLNYSVDTGINDGQIYYDGKTWSYNALWSASVGQLQNALNGQESEAPIEVTFGSATGRKNAATQSVDYSMNFSAKPQANVEATLKSIELVDRGTDGELVTQDITSQAVISGNQISFNVPSSFNFAYSDFAGYEQYANYNYQVTLKLTYEIASAQGTYDFVVECPRVIYSYPHY